MHIQNSNHKHINSSCFLLFSLYVYDICFPFMKSSSHLRSWRNMLKKSIADLKCMILMSTVSDNIIIIWHVWRWQTHEIESTQSKYPAPPCRIFLTPASALCVTQPTDRGTENMATLLLWYRVERQMWKNSI